MVRGQGQVQGGSVQFRSRVGGNNRVVKVWTSSGCQRAHGAAVLVLHQDSLEWTGIAGLPDDLETETVVMDSNHPYHCC